MFFIIYVVPQHVTEKDVQPSRVTLHDKLQKLQNTAACILTFQGLRAIQATP